MNGPHLARQLVLLLSAVPVFLFVSVSAVWVEVIFYPDVVKPKLNKKKIKKTELSRVWTQIFVK